MIDLAIVALFSFTAGFVAANFTWRIRRRSKLSNDAAVIAQAQRRLERKRERQRVAGYTNLRRGQ